MFMLRSFAQGPSDMLLHWAERLGAWASAKATQGTAAGLRQGQGLGGPAVRATNASRSPAVRRMAEQAGKEGGGGEGGEAVISGGWFKDFARSKLRLLLAAGLGVLALNAGVGVAADYYYHKLVLNTLMRGVLPPPVPPPELDRPELRRKVQELLQPREASRFYHIVTGPPGGGKSTLVRDACHALGSGVGYLDINPTFEVDFGRDLGNAFNFRFQEHMTAINMVAKPVLGTQYEDPSTKHPLSTVRQSAEALHTAAAEFRQKTGRPFVLVIDSADRLARSEDSEKVLAAMRSYARDWAQEGTITTVFVAHEWSTVEKLTGDHPSQSRSGPPLRVPDISQAQALEYLGALGVEPKMAVKCAGLVGGSLLLLQRSAALAKAGGPFPEIKQQMLDLIEIAFIQAGLLDQTPQREGGLKAVEALLQSRKGAICAAEFRECLPEREQQQELLSRGVITFDGRQLTFTSRLSATYAAEALRSRLPREVAERHKGLKQPGWW